MSARAVCPPEVLALLPWYSEGGLGDAERGSVEAHAAGCAACRRELAFIDGSAEPELDSLPDREKLWANTLARIAAGDRLPERAARPRAARPWRLAFAAAAGVLIALGAELWAGRTLRGREAGVEYRVAAETAAPPGARPELDVVFQPDASAERIGAALRDIEADIVSGPSPVSGIYRVRLRAGGDTVRAAEDLRSGVAQFAEPVPHP